MWIAQISDPHVRPHGVLYQGVVDANRALAEAIDQINALDPQPDLVLLSGDVVDQAQPEDYAAARDILAALRPALRLIPGNHDEGAAFRASFRDHAYLPAGGPLSYVDDASGAVRLVAVDVTVPGQHHGDLDSGTLDWLAGVLSADPDRPTLIMMHQPPFLSDIPYLDAYRCHGADKLAAIVSRYPAVERILCGHVHRSMQLRFAGTLLCTAPSTATAIALRPRSDAEPASYREPPGFLLHHWRPDRGVLTHTVPIGRFPGPFDFA